LADRARQVFITERPARELFRQDAVRRTLTHLTRQQFSWMTEAGPQYCGQSPLLPWPILTTFASVIAPTGSSVMCEV
jgi:hypothetical protein